MQLINKIELQSKLRKNMVSAIVKIKSYEAKVLLFQAQTEFDNSIKYGNGEQIYQSARKLMQAHNRLKNIRTINTTLSCNKYQKIQTQEE